MYEGLARAAENEDSMSPQPFPGKRPKLPAEIHLHAVAPGSFAGGDAGVYASADGDVTVHIEGDATGAFQVDRVEVFDLERGDPDAPPGTLELMPVGSVDGQGPIAVSANEAVLVSVRFTAPMPPSADAFAATAVMVALTWPAPVRIPLTATVAGVEVDVITPSFRIAQGGTATAKLMVRSLGGPDARVNFFSLTAPQGVFTDPATQSCFVPRDGAVPFDLVFRADRQAPPGVHELQGLAFNAFEGEQDGEFALDHRLTVEVLFVPGPPVPDPRVDHFNVVWVPGSTSRIYQLTGRGDPTGLPHPTDTTRFDLLRTDLGISVDHSFHGERRTYFFFGDTDSDGGAAGGDAIAFTVDDHAEPDGVHLQFVMGDNQWRRLVIPGVSLDIFEVPTGSFSHAGRLFIFATTDNFGIIDDGQQMGRSVLASAPDPQGNFEKHYDVSNFRTDWSDDSRGGGKFINVSPWKILNDDWPGLPVAGRGGEGLMMMGSGKYHMSPPYIAYLPLLPDQIPPKSTWRYLQGFLFWEPGFGPNGPPAWSESESDAIPLFDSRDLGELSFGWNADLRRWIVVYNGCMPRRMRDPAAVRPVSVGSVVGPTAYL
jgi:Domain of unknown function (DUF4185)